LSPTKLEKRSEQVLPGSKAVRAMEEAGGRNDPNNVSIYEYVRKKKKYKKILKGLKSTWRKKTLSSKKKKRKKEI
jgi:hypothetical protein